MTIHLPEHREQFVRSLVQGGRYASEAEVIEQAFRLLEQQDSLAGTVQQRRDAGQPGSPLSPDELNRRLLATGLVLQLPDPLQDTDDDADPPLVIDGEPLSETIIRERR